MSIDEEALKRVLYQIEDILCDIARESDYVSRSDVSNLYTLIGSVVNDDDVGDCDEL